MHDLLGKNLCLYFPIGVWLVMNRGRAHVRGAFYNFDEINLIENITKQVE